jgi:hypothetical protein
LWCIYYNVSPLSRKSRSTFFIEAWIFLGKAIV